MVEEIHTETTSLKTLKIKPRKSQRDGTFMNSASGTPASQYLTGTQLNG